MEIPEDAQADIVRGAHDYRRLAGEDIRRLVVSREEIEACLSTPLAKTHTAFYDAMNEDRYEYYGILATDHDIEIGTTITDDIIVFETSLSVDIDIALERAERMNKRNLYLVGSCNRRGIPTKGYPNCCEYGKSQFVAYTEVLAKAFK